MKKKPTYIGLILSTLMLTAVHSPLQANQDSDAVHVEEALNLSHDDKMKLLATHLDPNVFNPDYRFQRDAAVVAVGCGTIPHNIFPDHATDCYKKGWRAIRSGKLKFGTLINEVCSRVHETLPGADWHTAISYDSCMKNLVEAYPEPTKSLLQSKIADCHGTYWGPDYMNITDECYKARVPDIEQDLENMQKGQVFTIADEQTADAVDGTVIKDELLFVDDIPETDMNPDTAKAGAVRKIITQDYPPRSFWDRQKLDALHGGCTAMNTTYLTDEEVLFEKEKIAKRMESLLKSDRSVDREDKAKLQKILGNQNPRAYVMAQPRIEDIFLSPYEKQTTSWWRDDHCFADGFYSMAFGATTPSVLSHACKGRIPGAQWDIFTNTHITAWPKLVKGPRVVRNSEGELRITIPKFSKIKGEFGMFTNYKHEFNIVDLIDHKTTCLKAGVRNIDMRPYQDIINDSATNVFETASNLINGFVFNNNAYEEKLKLKDANLIRQQKLSQPQRDKNGSVQNGLPESSITAQAALLQYLQTHPELIDKAATQIKATIPARKN